MFDVSRLRFSMADLSIHPACSLFPPLPHEGLQALAESIKEQGLLIPIIMLNGQVLDGQNRLAACQIAGVKPIFKDANDVPAFKNVSSDPYAFVVAMNLNRRHLSESERAMIAAKIANIKHGQHKQDGPIGPAAAEKKSTDDAARLLNVSPRSVKRAKQVQESGAPELVNAVTQGQVSVSAAADIATLPKPEQKAVVEAGPEHVKKTAKAVRQAKVAKKPKAPECEPCGDWQRMRELADAGRKCAAQMAALSVDAQYRIQARDLCAGLAEAFMKLAVKFWKG